MSSPVDTNNEVSSAVNQYVELSVSSRHNKPRMLVDTNVKSLDTQFSSLSRCNVSENGPHSFPISEQSAFIPHYRPQYVPSVFHASVLSTLSCWQSSPPPNSKPQVTSFHTILPLNTNAQMYPRPILT